MVSGYDPKVLSQELSHILSQTLSHMSYNFDRSAQKKKKTVALPKSGHYLILREHWHFARTPARTPRTSLPAPTTQRTRLPATPTRRTERKAMNTWEEWTLSFFASVGAIEDWKLSYFASAGTSQEWKLSYFASVGTSQKWKLSYFASVGTSEEWKLSYFASVGTSQQWKLSYFASVEGTTRPVQPPSQSRTTRKAKPRTEISI